MKQITDALGVAFTVGMGLITLKAVDKAFSKLNKKQKKTKKRCLF